MCGITGITNLTPEAPPVSADELRTMSAELRHRGPDDEGYHLDPHGACGLGFRRLAIIDLATGNQPVANTSGTLHVVFNGEIYNFRELRAELELHGHQFLTQGDAEVIVHAYEHWGTDCFARLHGMFAIAVWDETRRELILARDRFGKKPLCYATFNNRLHFASEAKAILALPGAPRALDPQALHHYLVFQYVPAPRAIYRHFHKVPPGTFVRVVDGNIERPSSFYHIPSPPPFTGTYDDAKAGLGELLTTAVRKRLIADVPLGAFLSGGVDSSIIVGLMRELGVSPLRTFSIGFTDQRYDESAHARRVAAHFDTEHHEQVVTPQARDVLDTLAYHYDEPFADSSAIPTWYVARHTRQHVTVALTGDAGDECFAGYDRYRAAQLARRFDWLPLPARRLVAGAASLLPHNRPRTLSNRAYRFLSALGRSPVERYLAWINIFNPATLATGYHPEFLAALDFAEPLDWFANLYDGAPPPAANQAVHTDFASYLPYDLLTKVDLASMACSLECRAPFLDHKLVEFALSLPLEWRLGPSDGKHILKDWARDRLPPGLLDRPKMGFGVPVGEWFRNELSGFVRETLLADNTLVRRVFRPDWLHGYVEAHISGRANHEHPLWALLMLELWHRRWNPTVSL